MPRVLAELGSDPGLSQTKPLTSVLRHLSWADGGPPLLLSDTSPQGARGLWEETAGRWGHSLEELGLTLLQPSRPGKPVGSQLRGAGP